MIRSFLQGMFAGPVWVFFAGLAVWRVFRRPKRILPPEELLAHLLAESLDPDE